LLNDVISKPVLLRQNERATDWFIGI